MSDRLNDARRRRFCKTIALGMAAVSAPVLAAPRAKKQGAPKPTPAMPKRVDYATRPDVLDYIERLAIDEGFDRNALLEIFAGVRFNETASRLMTPGPTSVRRDWNVYRARFVEPVRLSAGYAYWDRNEALLNRAAREFGVPEEIVVGILGVETVYGRNTGSFRVIDALTTLAFDHPRGTDPDRQRARSAFFRSELTEALRLVRAEALDVSTWRGSYAGAVGMPQFMPGSIRRFGIDYDGDGHVDLVHSDADVIGSVANYLASHGWVRDLVTHVPLTRAVVIDPVQAAELDAMVKAGSVPAYTFADLQRVGFSAASSPPDAPLALIDLPVGSDADGRAVVSYLAGTQNFHAVTRYNRSYFYAFSVIELGSTIKTLVTAQRSR